MLLDNQNYFSDSQAVTSTAISENVIDTASLDLSPTTQDLGVGEDIWLVVQTAVAATDSGDDATLTITLESDSAAGLDDSATVHYSSGAIAFADFSPAGTVVLAVRLPKGEYERYLGLRYTVASGPLTAGQFDAFLTKNIDAYRAYGDNVTISS